MISVVSPVFRAVGCVTELHQRLTATLRAIGEEYEIVLVDDGSDDGSDDEIRAITDPHVRGMFIPQNVGQQRAILEGLQHCRGEWVVVMDCDLQDPPEAIARLWEARSEILIARRTRRRGWRGIVSRLWRATAGIPRGVGNFSIVHRRVIDEILRSEEPYLKQLLRRPYRTIDVPYAKRFQGRSAYTLRKLLRHAARMR